MSSNSSEARPKVQPEGRYSLPLPKRIRNHVNPLASQENTIFSGFANAKPLMVDIGAYRGEFAQQLVEKYSETHNFIVTEIRKPYEAYLKELFSKNDNVAVYGGDSARNIQNLLEASVKKGTEVEYIFINFPDPWFKDKHKKRRVLNNNFLNTLAGFINPNCKIIFQTDQQELFNETVEVIKENKRWNITNFSEPLWNIQSYWEQMKVQEGSGVYRMELTLA